MSLLYDLYLSLSFYAIVSFLCSCVYPWLFSLEIDKKYVCHNWSTSVNLSVLQCFSFYSCRTVSTPYFNFSMSVTAILLRSLDTLMSHGFLPVSTHTSSQVTVIFVKLLKTLKAFCSSSVPSDITFVRWAVPWLPLVLLLTCTTTCFLSSKSSIITFSFENSCGPKLYE